MKHYLILPSTLAISLWLSGGIAAPVNVDLSFAWEHENHGAEGMTYQIYRLSGQERVPIGGPQTELTAIVSDSIETGQEYFYVVTAQAAGLESEPSNQARVSIDASLLAPFGLQVQGAFECTVQGNIQADCRINNN